MPGEVWAHPEDELVMDGALAAHTQRRRELHACKYVKWKKSCFGEKWNFSDTITVSGAVFTSGTLLQRRVTSLDTFYFSIISSGATHSSVALSDGDSRSQDVCQWPLWSWWTRWWPGSEEHQADAVTDWLWARTLQPSFSQIVTDSVQQQQCHPVPVLTTNSRHQKTLIWCIIELFHSFSHF